MTRPLYIYTTADILNAKPQVAAYVSTYLENADDFVSGVGYFPAEPGAIDSAKEIVMEALRDRDRWPALIPPNMMAGSTSSAAQPFFPFPGVAAEVFKAQGFPDSIDITSSGTGGGFNAFCVEALPDLDIVNASRPANAVEFDILSSQRP